MFNSIKCFIWLTYYDCTLEAWGSLIIESQGSTTWSDLGKTRASPISWCRTSVGGRTTTFESLWTTFVSHWYLESDWTIAAALLLYGISDTNALSTAHRRAIWPSGRNCTGFAEDWTHTNNIWRQINHVQVIILYYIYKYPMPSRIDLDRFCSLYKQGVSCSRSS